MPEVFDPYYSWLGIPPAEQPADYYRLLGLSRFESNSEVIANAAEQRIRHVRTFQLGENAERSHTLLNELATARACLLNSASKAAYDQQLRDKIPEQNPPPVASRVSATTSTVQRSTRRRARSPRVEVVKIVVGGLAGLTVGVLLLWYSFSTDVLGVMESRDERLAKPFAQDGTNARQPESKKTKVKPPEAALRFDGHSYLAIHIHNVDWKQASVLCERMGGHLATIGSKNEFEFLKKIVGDQYGGRNLWLGGERVNGQWQWIDGSRIDDSLWHKSPIQKPGWIYVYINGIGSIWYNDSPCETIPGFICEWDN